MKPGERVKQAAAGTAEAVQQEIAGKGGEVATEAVVDRASVDAILSTWDAIPQKVARRMIEKYGPPNEATASRLIWYETGPWKRTIVYRDQVPHNFPKPHTDVLEQFIDYHVPPAKAGEIAAYDGSVIVERTKGEISARCDMEEMNFLAVNLMHEIVTGRRTVEDARKFYAETAVAFVMNRPAPYTERLLFEIAQGNTADRDEVLIAQPMLDQMKEKMKDVVSGQSG